jgi:molybdopterin-guanine dinucleotide biosynthesis protein A
VVLAGGQGRRIGGQKATVGLGGRPLIEYPLQVLSTVLDEVAVVAKPDTTLPSLPGVTVWIEPQEPHHPLVGIVEALAVAGGRPVLVCACDLPLLTPALVRALARADPCGRPAVVAVADGQLQPLLGCYQASALTPLRRLAAEAKVALRAAVASLEPRLLDVGEAESLFNVNSPEDLLHAATLLDQRAGD